jgi:hypothetical protein
MVQVVIQETRMDASRPAMYAGMHLADAAAPNSATGETLRLLMRALKRRPSKEKESDEQNPENARAALVSASCHVP